MNLLHPASAGAAVALWFANEVPVRIVHGITRYRVITATQGEDGWVITARSASGQTSRFDIRSREGGWQLRSAS
jgi:SH3-like domain-containing protein